MDKYSYKAWNSKFEVVKGKIEEEDIETAKDRLKLQGLTVIDIKKAFDFNEISFSRLKLKDGELANFCGQMGMILNSGLNVLSGLEVLQSQMKEKKLQKIVGIVHANVRRGRSLASAMQDTNAFPKLLCDMVASGELSGNVDEAFINMEAFYEREARIKSKIVTASIYPAMLLVVAIGMIAFFNIFVFEELGSLFSDMENLPAATKMLLGFMNFLNGNFAYILLTVTALAFTFIFATRHEKSAYYIDKIKLKMPMLGEFRIHMITARFSRSMALFLKSGVPMLNLMDSLKLLVDNQYMAVKIEDVKNELINGRAISSSLEKQNIFEPIVVQTIRVGEETGRLEESLSNLANIYDKKIEAEVSKLMAIIEPAFTLVIGIFVAVLILTIAMPVMNMTGSFR
ncbi:type II secretion system F family protein [Clostridium thermarum]|uniref:type II secretion system F family protein n=1 Tax=Clostridium thermarum TaxID=1716543 RepID=UPI0011235933|nr:type II secretion system F family protein [Clostridium thermarum]